MELIGRDATGAETCRIWIEAKTGANYLDMQLEDYAADLRGWSSSKLLTIVERPDQVREHGDWRRATWADVAATAVDILREELPADRRGRGWRERVWHPTTPAALRALGELLEYLDKEHGFVSDPLTTTDVMTFAGISRAGDVLHALLARAAELSLLSFRGEPEWHSEDWASGWVTFTDTGKWWHNFDGVTELHLAAADTYFGATRRGEPAIGVGANIARGYGQTIFNDHPKWVVDLRNAGFDPFPDDNWVRLYRSVYLAEVLAAGSTLESQAAFVAERLRVGVADLSKLAPPGPLTLPPSRGQRSRGTSGDGVGSTDQ
jgi:hypothetical protein